MTDTLKRVAETLADHGQREAAAEVADISLLIKAAVTASTSKQAEGDGDDDGKEFADLLKKGGMQVKYNAKTDSGTASGSGISLEFSPSSNDGGVWVEVTMRKFKAASGEAADAVLDMVKAVRKVY